MRFAISEWDILCKISPKRKQSFQHIRMEVDDAIVMAEPTAATVDDKTVLGGAEEGGERDQNTPTCSSAKQKRAKLKHDKEEPPGEEPELPNSESMVTVTPMKLEVSGSEDERDNDEENDDDGDGGGDEITRAAIRRKLLSTPLEDDGTANDGLEEYEAVAFKRKRYEVRRSGSEDCLLGFDELSGEAELIKPEDVQESPTRDEIDEKPVVENIPLVAAEVPVSSPKSVKKVIFI